MSSRSRPVSRPEGPEDRARLRRRAIRRPLIQRRHEKGAIAVEMAYSMLIMVIILMAGVWFSTAVTTRAHLSNAVSRATRVCAAVGFAGNAGALANCVNQEMADHLGDNGTRAARHCRQLLIQPEVQPRAIPGAPGQAVTVLRVQAVCRYGFGAQTGATGRQLLRRQGLVGIDWNLTAEAAMPLP
jgi:hypothetical protein